MALALEGTPVHNNASSGSSIVTGAFTTTQAAEVVIAITINSVTISSITGGGLTFAKRTSNAAGIEEWAAPAAAALSGVQFTINFSGATGFVTTDTFAVSGQDTATVFDANAAVPANGTADPGSISTSNANDFILGAFRFAATAAPTQGAGYTKISGADFQLSEYQIVSATQSGLSITVGTGVGNANGFVGDAIMQAGGAASVTYPQLERFGHRGAFRGMLH